jgi:hypothetical protein
MTDPTGVAVNYGYDRAGQLNNVTGSTYAGVSHYATGMQYRAFGGLKSLNYGNNLGLTQGFDTRQRLTGLQVGSQLSSAFQYYDDGQIRFAKDNTNPVMDRAYDYDLAGRLSEGLSGGEARDFVNGTQGSEADGIYRQSYRYDVWDNLTGRPLNRFWSGGSPFSTSFVNDRENGSYYDAEGNVLSDRMDDRTRKYDAAGQQVQTREQSQSSPGSLGTGGGGGGVTPSGEDSTNAESPWMDAPIPEGGHYTTTTLTITQSYDGDNRQTKRVEKKVSSTPFYQPVTTERADYYVRSSVLGGKVITELNSAGNKTKTYVYASGEIIAEQQLYYGGEQTLTWKQSNPVTGTEAEQHTSNGMNYKKEYDPFGRELGESDPYLNNAEPDYASLPGGSFYRSGGNPFGGDSACQWNGAPIRCESIGFIARTQEVVGFNVREQGHEGGGFAMRFGLVRAWRDTANNSRVIDDENKAGPWSTPVTDRGFYYMLAGTGFYATGQPRVANFGPISETNVQVANNTVVKNYDRCKSKYFGNSDVLGSRHIPGMHASALSLAAGFLNTEYAASIAGIFSQESDFSLNPSKWGGDAGPAQLTGAVLQYWPGALVGDAFGSRLVTNSKGKLAINNRGQWDGSILDNLATLRNIVMHYPTAYDAAYAYGPGFKGDKKKNHEVRTDYAKDVTSRTPTYKQFFNCLMGNE